MFLQDWLLISTPVQHLAAVVKVLSSKTTTMGIAIIITIIFIKVCRHFWVRHHRIWVLCSCVIWKNLLVRTRWEDTLWDSDNPTTIITTIIIWIITAVQMHPMAILGVWITSRIINGSQMISFDHLRLSIKLMGNTIDFEFCFYNLFLSQWINYLAYHLSFLALFAFFLHKIS